MVKRIIGGMKTSQTMCNNNGMLYIFENKNGVKYVYDGLNAFARTIKVDASNLYRTFKHKTYSCNGWKLIDCLDLCNPDWGLINKKIRKCKVIDRIYKKLDEIEKNLLSVKKFGRLAWNMLSRFKSKNNPFKQYVEEKEREYVEEQKSRPVFKKTMVTSDEYEEMLQRNLSLYEDQMMGL